MTTIEIDVISDFVCSWCYVGKKQLDRAIALYQKVYPNGKDDKFIIRYRPYFLQYNQDGPSVDKEVLAEKRLAGMSQEKRKVLTRRMNQIGESVGIKFSWKGKIGPTMDAHRLMHLVREESATTQEAIVEDIFRAYHVQERDISSKEVLAGIAAEHGLRRDEVKDWLSSHEAKDDVVQEANHYRDIRSKTGVPAYIVQGIHRLEGSQDSQDFLELFIRVKEEEKKVTA
ncbi:hypothetical protein S40288_04304 [Stachybotrys chartarum IBT 40288]|nr:hypothetical protein S40288_04304 [Stachybotrys chartarum IBT 40288]